MTLHNLNDLFEMELQDLYDAEQRILKALPKVIDAASDEKLKKAFKEHSEITKEQATRLERIGKDLGIDMKKKACKGMEGVLKEAEELFSIDAPAEVMDAALISAAQRVEHYEIAGYGTVVTFAKMLGYKNSAQLLKQTLDEEEKADKTLSEIATSSVNQEAEHPNSHGSYMSVH